ncbi:MAG: hypothetical protein HY077_17765 [Elusimicrobia bacterium]|nr:hypothetical protein [Elusimicrobiota bacterium]
MTRNVLFLLALLAFAAPSRAETGSFFDGSGGGPELPALKFQAAKTDSAQGAPSKQSGADLYYFTPQEAKEAAKRFKFRPKMRGWTFDSNVPQNIQDQMLADLAFMKGIAAEKATPLHSQIFGKGGAAYAEFFESRVTGIGMNSCGSAKAVACVIPFMDPTKMWLTQNFVKFSHPQVSRMMVVYHEARHTESDNGNWPHARCPDPFKDANGNDMKSIWTGALLAGEPACDETPFGSYGSSTILLKNISKFCTNCTEKVKMDAGLYADDQFGRIIDDGARKQMQDDLYR